MLKMPKMPRKNPEDFRHLPDYPGADVTCLGGLNLLRRARRLMQKGWCGSLEAVATTKEGEACEVMDPNARHFTIMGALLRANGGDGEGTFFYVAERAVEEWTNPFDFHDNDIHWFNANEGREVSIATVSGAISDLRAWLRRLKKGLSWW